MARLLAESLAQAGRLRRRPDLRGWSQVFARLCRARGPAAVEPVLRWYCRRLRALPIAQSARGFAAAFERLAALMRKGAAPAPADARALRLAERLRVYRWPPELGRALESLCADTLAALDGLRAALDRARSAAGPAEALVLAELAAACADGESFACRWLEESNRLAHALDGYTPAQAALDTRSRRFRRWAERVCYDYAGGSPAAARALELLDAQITQV